MAAPAEWPITIFGEKSSTPSREASARAIPGSERSGVRFASVKPWPGRSGATRRKRCASSGASPSQEWVEAPVPCTINTSGPVPIV